MFSGSNLLNLKNIGLGSSSSSNISSSQLRRRKSNTYRYKDFDPEKILHSEKEYLRYLAEKGFKIPKEKINLFKLLILKEDPLKVGQAMIKKSIVAKHLGIIDEIVPKQKMYQRRSSLDFFTGANSKKEMDIIEKARVRMEKKMEQKLVSQAAKNFNIHLHIRDLQKENHDYLERLGQAVKTKLNLFMHPSKTGRHKDIKLDTSMHLFHNYFIDSSEK